MSYLKALTRLKDRSYATYSARLQAEKRLAALGHWWNAAQVALASALLSISIIFLASDPSVLPGGEMLLAVLSVLSLVVSVVISNLEFAAKRQEMFRSYRDIQTLSVTVERLLDLNRHVSRSEVSRLSKEYQDLLDTSPNHSSVDHLRASAGGRFISMPFSAAMSSLVPYFMPVFFTVSSVLLVVYVVVSAAGRSIG